MFDLFKAIGLGLAVLLPLANPLTTVALFLGLVGNMNNAERNKQALMASVYVFAILMVSWYAGQVVMNTFGISIPGLRIARRIDCGLYRFPHAVSPAKSPRFNGSEDQIGRTAG